MPRIKFELDFDNTCEWVMAENLSRHVRDIKTNDCRELANSIRAMISYAKLPMVVGCGGSHVYIHREHEFIAGEHTNPNNKRWAIITDDQNLPEYFVRHEYQVNLPNGDIDFVTVDDLPEHIATRFVQTKYPNQKVELLMTNTGKNEY